jgi:hypothetical protein
VTRLSKDAILAALDLPREVVAVPEWGGEVLVQGLTGAQKDEFEMSLYVRKGERLVYQPANVRAKLVARCIITDQGERVFGDADIEALSRKSAAALDRCYEACSRLSGLSPKDLGELEKN